METAKALLIAALLSTPLMAADYEPYPDAAINVQQWQEYFDVIQEEFGSTREEVPDADLVVFHDEQTSTQYAFTLPDNPAHPAWVTRKVVQQGDSIYFEQIGYFAGDEEAFADLYDVYAELADEVRQELEAKQEQ